MSKVKNKILSWLRENNSKILCILCLIVSNMCLISYLYPFDRPLVGHDYAYHYLRVEALKYNIENNNLFTGIDYLYFGGGGYAGFSYPEIFLFIPALLRIAGGSIGESMTVFLILCNVLAYCFMYIFMSDVTKSDICGTMAAVLYVLSTYRIDNIITRFALGEILAGVFLPLVLYGLYDFIFGEFKKPYILSIGFVGLLLSHSISTLLALILTIVISAFFIKRIISDRKKLPRLFITALCSVAVTTFYWLPFLELFTSCEMSVQKSAYNTIDYAVPFYGLFREIMHNGIAGMKFPIYLLCVPRIFITKSSPIYKSCIIDEKTQKRKDIFVLADVLLILGIVLSVLSTTLVPWEYLSKVLNFMQFPWRFFLFAQIFLVIAGTVYVYCIAKYTKSTKITLVLITGICMLIAGVHAEATVVSHTENAYENDYYSDVSKTCSIGCGEWLPRAANREGVNQVMAMGDRVKLDNGIYEDCTRINGTLTFELDKTAEYAIVPYIWYKGYKAYDENGDPLEITMSEHGLVKVDLRGASGEITVKHSPTTIRIVSEIISIVSLVSIIVLAVISKRKKALKTREEVKLN